MRCLPAALALCLLLVLPGVLLAHRQPDSGYGDDEADVTDAYGGYSEDEEQLAAPGDLVVLDFTLTPETVDLAVHNTITVSCACV